MSKKEKNVLIGDVNNLFQENTCEAVHLKLKLEMEASRALDEED